MQTVAEPTRFRGMARVRADANDPATLFAQLNTAFASFKAENDKQLADLKKGLGDVVQAEKVDRINAEVTALQKALDETNTKLVTAQLGGAGQLDPAKAEHRKVFGQYFRKGDKGLSADLGELEVKAKLTTQSNPDGGYTVPEEVDRAIDRVMGTMTAMRSTATVRTIGAATYKKLVNMGGTDSGWVDEQGDRPETSTPQLSGLEFTAMELYAQPAATQTMLDDSFMDVEAWLSDEVSLAFVEQEGDAFINGNHPKKPRGLLSYDKVANASYAWGKLGYVVSGNASNFAGSNPSDAFLDLIYALKRGHRSNARWLMNDLTVGKIRKFKDGQGNYLWQPSAQAGEPAQFMGYGLVDDDGMPDVGADAFPIAFGDFKRGYLILDRKGVRVLRDPFTAKPHVLFYTTKRVAGGVQNFEAIKLMKIST